MLSLHPLPATGALQVVLVRNGCCQSPGWRLWLLSGSWALYSWGGAVISSSFSLHIALWLLWALKPAQLKSCHEARGSGPAQTANFV